MQAVTIFGSETWVKNPTSSGPGRVSAQVIHMDHWEAAPEVIRWEFVVPTFGDRD